MRRADDRQETGGVAAPGCPEGVFGALTCARPAIDEGRGSGGAAVPLLATDTF